MTTCTYCDARGVRCSTVAVGTAPASERARCTQADHRKIVVVRVCLAHNHKIGAPK